MALIKKGEMKAMDVAALEKKLVEFENELHAERSQLKSTGKPANVGRLQTLKKGVARINTFLRQKKVVTKGKTEKK
ncbi:50S ribosomal protein L29 [Candidatus Micrarchaeota archaeon CG_4_10_14_0_2_um_filter_60_11]|nr:MAG: 50S ribosomal protein L29 [Candidatus Micrarchaeota archaeon CG1_02_60_51]PIN96497.1 MAG: 50S ribosomal protein L29 [Candidatus Micrarchaeota archaeon CG10_big_fil_rev_8_21_14_0_10_60_32]PIO01869.1 MAG: 50S ribosomal protein L29 [Candidatus Micrarchaeota archaeon CG09_land_8_20_14_0_10_60_16]PIY91535.1 MAG: 50S ribosomal protein L29 [Candidatus Micrarchaeota archaeon CG_4_10_14_0_8_um_filter_60_7]PIZ90850.1 MAG: 50S ribosomal protein L29 [Candidatus Micrarchaeota archaeon CG_4_10_14_0_2